VLLLPNQIELDSIYFTVQERSSDQGFIVFSREKLMKWKQIQAVEAVLSIVLSDAEFDQIMVSFYFSYDNFWPDVFADFVSDQV